MQIKQIGVLPFLLIILIWPIFPAWITLFGRDWLMMPLLVVFCFFIVRPYFNTRIFTSSLLLFAVYILNAVVRPGEDRELLLQIIRISSLISASALSFFILTKATDKQISFLCKFTLVMLIFTTIAMIIMHSMYPMAVRNAVGGDLVKEEKVLAASLQRYGLSNFDIIHALPCMVPVFVMGFKSYWLPKTERLFYLGMVFICIVHTYISGFTTPLLVVLLAFVMALFLSVRVKQRKAFMFVLYIVLAIVAVIPEVFSSITSSIINLMGADFSEMQSRVDMVNGYVQTGDSSEGDLGERVRLYQLSWDSFISNPLIGVGTHSEGGHSFVLQTLATYGILGIVSIALYFALQLKFIVKRLNENAVSFYYLAIFSSLIMLFSKNVGTWTTWCFLFVLSPMFMKYIYSRKPNYEHPMAR